MPPASKLNKPKTLQNDRNVVIATQPHLTLSPQEEDHAVAHALAMLGAKLRTRPVLSNPEAVKAFLRLQSHGLTHEIFAVMYLDSQSRLIEYERLFHGTLTHTWVHPREVARQALVKSAAAVILHHNHPSGTCRPSERDEALTRRLQEVLALVEVRVTDHVITSSEGAFSMAEHGLLA